MATYSDMNTLYELRNAQTGKLVCQMTTLSCALREAKWRGAVVSNGRLTGFKITRIFRDGWGGLIARSNRYGGIWPLQKLVEFAFRWLRGDMLRVLESYFDTSAPSLAKKCRELGLPRREPAGLWNPADEEAINFMFDEGMTEDEIAQHFKRSTCSVGGRLRKSSLTYSDRHYRRTEAAPSRYGASARARKKEISRKMDEARKLARCGKNNIQTVGRISPPEMENT